LASTAFEGLNPSVSTFVKLGKETLVALPLTELQFVLAITAAEEVELVVSSFGVAG
jgi:hypothetical protein